MQPAIKKFSFHKEERLKSRKLIETLFREGKAFSVSPFRVLYLPLSLPTQRYPVQVGFSVPARHFRKAVDRNRIKRLCREAYRVQKQKLYDHLQHPYALFFIYTDKKIQPYSFIHHKISVILDRLIAKCDQQHVGHA